MGYALDERHALKVYWEGFPLTAVEAEFACGGLAYRRGVRKEELDGILPVIMAARLREEPCEAEQAVIFTRLAPGTHSLPRRGRQQKNSKRPAGIALDIRAERSYNEQANFGELCNGSTYDSDSYCLGSKS